PGRLLRLTRKELREVLRDRRTLFTLVLMPLLLYPLLGVALSFFLAGLGSTGGLQYRLGLEDEAVWRRLEALLRRGGAVWAVPGPDVALVPFVCDAMDSALRIGDIHLAIRSRPAAAPDRASTSPWPADFEVLYDPDSPLGREALTFVYGRLTAAN